MTDVVMSVIILIAIGLIGVTWCICYILMIDKNEEKEASLHSDHSTSSDE